MKRRIHELAAAFGLLTRLPVGPFLSADPVGSYADCVWAYPVVGIKVGFLGGVAFWLAVRCGVPPALAAGWTLAALVLMTGALHEDGLADTADGFGGGRGRERKLEIMRDSRIGSYGAIALILSLELRWAAIATIASPFAVLLALIVAGALGRAAMVAVLLVLKPARSDGLAASLGQVPVPAAATGLAIALLAAVVLLPFSTACAGIVWALIGVATMAWLARGQVGGYTGDVLGATEIVVECLVLTVLAS